MLPGLLSYGIYIFSRQSFSYWFVIRVGVSARVNDFQFKVFVAWIFNSRVQFFSPYVREQTLPAVRGTDRREEFCSQVFPILGGWPHLDSQSRWGGVRCRLTAWGWLVGSDDSVIRLLSGLATTSWNDRLLTSLLCSLRSCRLLRSFTDGCTASRH